MSLNRPLVVLLVLLTIGIATWRLRSGQGDDQLVRRTRIIMGTLVEITALGPDQAQLDDALNAAFAEMSRIEELMSSHLPQSEVSRLSAAPGPMAVSPETASVIAQGLEIAARSDGAFDLGLGRLIAAWDILGEHPKVPSAAAIAAALQGVGPGDIQLSGQTVSKSRPDLAMDLGSIAKGYAVDRACQLLRERGISHASVNAGGDLMLIGDREGRPWRIGIQHPRKPGEVLALVELNGGSIVTSGDYERFFEQDGVRYHHLLDPATGQPARGCQSVTVVAPNATLADALATAAFVLGPEKGLRFLHQWPGVEGIIVDAAGKAVVTAGLKDRVTWP